MFCPKCATQNVEGASFCRVCGANISLIPQALTGEMPAQESDSGCATTSARKGRRGKEIGLDTAFKNVFTGIGFVLVALALSASIGRGWWFWLLIPAFSMMGTGIAQFIRFKEQQRRREVGPRIGFQSEMPPAARPTAFPPRRNTGELVAPPPSVTEGTTRHLGGEAATRHLDAAGESNR